MGMTPIQRRLLEPPGGERITFSHAVLAQCGLPRRRITASSYERTNGNTSLLVTAGKLWNPDRQAWEVQPLPYGAHPRLTLFFVSERAVRTKNRTVEIGNSLREFLTGLGLGTDGRVYNRFRQQMASLAACDMRLGVGSATILNAKPVSVFQPWVRGPDCQRALLPGTITLSGEFYESLRESAVPLDMEAVGKLRHSALALDLYTWLAHRLRRVSSAQGDFLSWANLLGQFGEYRTVRDFKRELLEAMRAVRSVYPDARVEQVRGGLRLMPSPAPVPALVVPVTLPLGPIS